MPKKIGKEIHFHFHPKDFEQGAHTIVKAEGESGQQRKYLCGISSGINIDAHGERMTEKCIKSFMDQANSGEILLFSDVHGIRESDDIGKLCKAEIMPTGDWYTEYRLYDEQDGIGPQKAEKIDTLWKQINGLPPYSKPRQKGFSVEGIIPDESIVMNSMGQINRSVIDDISLDGVVLVPRPAYKDSIATAIYKALGETSPYREESIKMHLRDMVEQEEIADNYYKLKWNYQDGLESVIEKIMKKTNNNKEEELGILFDEYKNLMTALIINSESVFADKQNPLEELIEETGVSLSQPQLASAIEKGSTDPKLGLYKSLYQNLYKLNKLLEARK